MEACTKCAEEAPQSENNSLTNLIGQLVQLKASPKDGTEEATSQAYIAALCRLRNQLCCLHHEVPVENYTCTAPSSPREGTTLAGDIIAQYRASHLVTNKASFNNMSVGSHSLGSLVCICGGVCAPCTYVRKPKGCRFDKDCIMCHRPEHKATQNLNPRRRLRKRAEASVTT